MLGDKLGEERGQITGFRVLPSEGGNPTVEVSFQASGQLLGVDVTDAGTYSSTLTPAGILSGSGQGIITTSDGEVITWSGGGLGRFTGRGSAVSWRGAIYLQTTSQKLARLNTVAVVFEYEVDENRNTHTQTWEWK